MASYTQPHSQGPLSSSLEKGEEGGPWERGCHTPSRGDLKLLQLNPYKAAILREVDSGRLIIGVGRLIEVKNNRRTLFGTLTTGRLIEGGRWVGVRLYFLWRVYYKNVGQVSILGLKGFKSALISLSLQGWYDG